MVTLREALSLLALVLWVPLQDLKQGGRPPCRADSGIDLTILLDDTKIYHGVLAACPDLLPDSLRERYTRAAFSFRPTRSLTWDNARTSRGERVEGTIWRAGTDSDAALIGISFVTRGRVVLNTIHVAALDTAAAFPLGAGIRSVTLPNKRLKLPGAHQ
jgi:hypothetical protein